MPRTTLEQWLVLQTIVDTGGFYPAARRLHRSQSAISYAMARLQERLGIELLHVDGRKAVLTPLGRALLEDARPLLRELVTLEMRAQALAQGAEPRVRLAVDSLYPKPILFAALARFARGFPHTRVDMTEIIRLTPGRCEADLSIAPHGPTPGDRLMDVELLAVAHKDHPLHHGGKARDSLIELAHHLQVSMEDGPRPSRDNIGAAQQIWSVNSVEAAIEAVRSSLCFGWLPRHAIENELRQGTLLPLPLGRGQVRRIPLELVYTDYERAGPATHALAQLLLTPAAEPLAPAG